MFGILMKLKYTLRASLILGLLWGAAWFSAPAQAAQANAPVRLLCFNIRYGTARDGANHWGQRVTGLLPFIEEVPAYQQLVHNLRHLLDSARPSPAGDDVGPAEVQGLDIISPARPYLLAALYQKLGRPIVLLTTRADRVSQWTEQLQVWTGNRWAVSVVAEGGGQTIDEVRNAEKYAMEAEARAHPLVRAVLDRFPDARIVDIRSREQIAAEAGAEALPEVEGEWDPFEED